MSRPPPATIALALSGGGYRAAAFHLGVLRALHDVGWLDRVRHLSTASGGTILGASWLHARKNGLDFDAFEARVREVLSKENVVLSAAKKLRDMEKPSLIVAAAAVYDEVLFRGDTLASLAGVIDEVRFNTTDMDTGNDFRFVIGNDKAVIGNARRHIDAAVRDRVRIADAVAASSCFPGAFEPIVFPDDFVGLGAGEPVGLMDGGIYDNQALDALLHIDEQGPAVLHKADLVIACDVDNPTEPIFAARAKPLPFPLSVPVRLRTAVAVVDVAALVTMLCAMAGLAASFWPSSESAARLSIIALSIAAALSTSLAVAWALGRTGVAKLVKQSLPFAWGDWEKHLGALRVPALVRIVERRLGSLVALAAGVFMKRVRTLGYGAAEAHFAASPSASTRPPSPLRIQTAQLHHKREPSVGTKRLVATDAQRAVRKAAIEEKTQLWFVADENLARVVLAGRMAALEAVDDHLDDADAAVRAAWDALAADCARVTTTSG